MSMTARGGQDDAHPLEVDGLRHRSTCEVFRTPAFQCQRLKCSCGASDLLFADGVMVIYDPVSAKPYNKPWWRTPFDGCFGSRKDSPSKCSWIAVWPEWMR